MNELIRDMQTKGLISVGRFLLIGKAVAVSNMVKAMTTVEYPPNKLVWQVYMWSFKN